jgi:CDGSH-type Zn-finger protein
MDTPHVAGRAPTVLTLEAGTYYWCQCGLSKTQPYCDGSHAGTIFSPKEFTVSEKKQVALCLCKATKGSPFCDGSHRNVPKA